MRNKILLLCMVLFPCMAFAQSSPGTGAHTIKGVLTDSLTLDGEPYATIKITTKENPENTIKMAVTDTKGRFNEKVNGTGDFIITLSSIGKTTVTKEYTTTKTNETIDLGTLHTAEATNELGSIEVVAQKPLVKVDVDKIEYNIEDDPDSKSNSVLEMLRKVPLVTVDGEDKIQVNGSSSFKVHVNGKPNNMMSDNPTEVLKSMPANTIKHIEVITNPGAKYDAEGIGGILNIVTIGGGFEGYTATFSANASNRGVGGSTYATIKKEKLTVTGNYSYSHHNQPVGRWYSEQEYLKSDEEKYLNKMSTNKNKGNFQQGNMEASYELDTLRLLTASVGMYGRNFNNTGYGKVNMLDVNKNPVYSYRSDNESDNGWFSIRGNVDYQRSFKTKDRLFTVSYKVNSQPRTNDYYNMYRDIVNVPENLGLFNQYSKGKANTIEHTLQADYTTPIGKYHTVETGAKYIIRNNTSDNKYYMDTEGTGDYIENKQRSSDYKHLNDIIAAYAGYTLRYKNFTFKPGLRYEYTFQDVKFKLTPEQNFDVTFSDLVPSVSLGTKIGKTQNIRGGYNMRIWRPSIYYLNPYVNNQDPTHIRYGNPDLESEKSHNFDINYSSFTAKFNLNVTLRHSFNNNSIEDVTTVNNNIMTTTFYNIGKSQSTNLSVYANWNATPKTRIYVNATGRYSDMKTDPGKLGSDVVSETLHNYGWSSYFYGGAQHTFPKKIRLSFNAGGSTPQINLQGRGWAYHYYSLNVNKTFLKDRLTVSAYCSNFFNKYTTYTNRKEGINFIENTKDKYQSRYFGMSVSYRIGELKASVKKASRGINNDDVKGGGEGGGGGGGQ